MLSLPQIHIAPARPSVLAPRISGHQAVAPRRGALCPLFVSTRSVTAKAQAQWELLPQAQTAMSEQDQHAAAALLAAKRPRIVLGSASSSRRGLMDELGKELGFTYEVATADINEKAIREDDPQQLVVRLAHAKADAIRDKLQAAGMHSGLLLTCDQVVVHEGRVLEKPHNEEEARHFIDGYARAPAQTVGSVICTDLDTRATFEGVDIATIHFSPLPQESVDRLIAEGSVFWCAGGLMVEHELVAPHVTKMEGTIDAVMGLPKALVTSLLLQALQAQEGA